MHSTIGETLQPPLFISHSLISTHEKPLPVNPGGHWPQTKDPGVFTHITFGSFEQCGRIAVHSSMSTVQDWVSLDFCHPCSQRQSYPNLLFTWTQVPWPQISLCGTFKQSIFLRVQCWPFHWSVHRHLDLKWNKLSWTWYYATYSYDPAEFMQVAPFWHPRSVSVNFAHSLKSTLQVGPSHESGHSHLNVSNMLKHVPPFWQG